MRKITFEGAGAVEAIVYDRPRLLHGNVIAGPAIIEEVASTTVVEPGDTVTVNEFGHLVMKLGAQSVARILGTDWNTSSRSNESNRSEI